MVMGKQQNPSHMKIERLRELLWYDPFSGQFRWMQSRGSITYGAVAGGTNANGYVQIQVDGENYYGHRLAWFWMHGVWPELIDHINGDKSDNKLVNLRIATTSQNTLNTWKPRSTNKSGFLGVSPRRNGFRAQIVVNGKNKYLGQYPTAELAQTAYLQAKLGIGSGSGKTER